MFLIDAFLIDVFLINVVLIAVFLLLLNAKVIRGLGENGLTINQSVRATGNTSFISHISPADMRGHH